MQKEQKWPEELVEEMLQLKDKYFATKNVKSLYSSVLLLQNIQLLDD